MGQKGLEKSQILTALGVYNIPRDTLEVIIPTTLEVYNIPGNTLKISSIPTADNTLEVYCIPGNVLEVYNIPNTRDNFAGNFDTCAGSFDRQVNVRPSFSYRRLHKNIRQFSTI